MEKLKCPECKSESISKNGKPRDRKPQYVCKDCSRYFTEDSSKGFPKTSLPFPFVAFILYILFGRKEHSGIKTVVDWVNHILPYMKFRKKSVTRKTIYQWMKNYGNIYKKVKRDQALNFFKESIDKTMEQELMQLSKHEISDYLKSQSMPSYPYLGEWSRTYFEELYKIKQNPSKQSVTLVPELFNVLMSFKISRQPIDFDKTMKTVADCPILMTPWIESQSNVIRVEVIDENISNKYFKYRPGTVSIQKSGKSTFTGVGDMKLAKETIKIITTKFSENDPSIIKNPRIRINNICAKIKLPRKISRNALLFALHGQDFEEKNNSCWTGKITSINKNSIELKMKIPNVSFKFYESGKVIISRAITEKDIYKAVEKLSNNFWLKPFINQHKS